MVEGLSGEVGGVGGGIWMEGRIGVHCVLVVRVLVGGELVTLLPGLS